MKRYIRASFDNYVPEWVAKSTDAKNGLNAKGIDLKKAVFTKEPTGRSKDFPIYLLRDGISSTQVWVPGYNDDMYITDPSDNKYKAIKYVSKKYLPIVDVVYVAKEGYNKARRNRYVDPRYNKDRYSRHAKYQGQYYAEPSNWAKERGETGKWVDSREPDRFRRGILRDKSGYLVPDPKERLAKFYGSEAGRSKLASRIERAYDDLIDIKKRIFDVDFASFGEEYSCDYSNMLSRFGDACRNYRLALKSLDRSNPYKIRDAFAYVREVERVIKDTRELLDSNIK